MKQLTEKEKNDAKRIVDVLETYSHDCNVMRALVHYLCYCDVEQLVTDIRALSKMVIK